MIDLESRDVRYALAQKRIDVVIGESASIRQRNHRLDLEGDRIKQFFWNRVIREWITDQLAITCEARRPRIVNRSFDDLLAHSDALWRRTGGRAEIFARDRLGEVAVTILLNRNRIRDRADRLVIPKLFKIEKEERFVMAIVKLAQKDRPAHSEAVIMSPNGRFGIEPWRGSV